MLKILELFGGIGACTQALKKIGIQVQVVDYVEIDKYAVKSFNAMNNTNFEMQDICKWDKDLKDIDLIMHGSPCQDFSIAGKQAGADEGSGTRSSLMYETIRIVEKIKPKYVIWENVKNILSKKHIHNFDNYINKLNELGYASYYKILNAKDYGIPQNRERVFTVSILGEHEPYEFPPKQELKLKLKDLLEDEVDGKYYLSEARINKIKNSNFVQEKKMIQEKDYCDTLLARDYKDPKCVVVNRKYGIFDNDKTKHQAGSVYDENGLSPTIDTMQGGWRQPCIEVKNATQSRVGKQVAQPSDNMGVVVERNLKQQLCDELIAKNKVKEMDVIRHSYSTSRMKDWENKNIERNNEAPTLDTRCDCLGVVLGKPLRIRKLTPKECWRLMRI